MKVQTSQQMAEMRIPATGSQALEDNFQYIADMATELRKLALGAQAPTLAHVLEVAMLEAVMQRDIHRTQQSLMDR